MKLSDWMILKENMDFEYCLERVKELESENERLQNQVNILINNLEWKDAVKKAEWLKGINVQEFLDQNRGRDDWKTDLPEDRSAVEKIKQVVNDGSLIDLLKRR